VVDVDAVFNETSFVGAVEACAARSGEKVAFLQKLKELVRTLAFDIFVIYRDEFFLRSQNIRSFRCLRLKTAKE
jgi:hypothetical protein